jgi:hypothetical protein
MVLSEEDVDEKPADVNIDQVSEVRVRRLVSS